MKTYCLHIPADHTLSSAARAIAVQIFKRVGFPEIEISRLKLVFDEIFMNAIRYGSIEGSSLYINFEVVGDKLEVSLEDEGGEKKVTAEQLREIIAEQASNTDPAKTSGRGLAQITAKWADDLKVWNGKKGGLCIGFSKSLSQKENSSGAAITVSPKGHTAPTKNISGLPKKVFSFVGEIDNANLNDKVRKVQDFIDSLKKPCLVILDFKQLTFLNSTCIAKVAVWKHELDQKKGELVIQNIPPDIMEIFDLVGITKLVTMLPGEFEEKTKNNGKIS